MSSFRLRPVSVLLVASFCAAALAGCPKNGEGPAERVGKSMDKGAAAVGRGIEKTGDAIEDAATGQ